MTVVRRLAQFAFVVACLLPSSGCGCRRSCSSNSSSFAPPPTPPCCDKAVPPAYLPPGGYQP